MLACKTTASSILAAAALLAAWCGPFPHRSVARGAPFDCTMAPLPRIAPGTQVPNGPPVGWTHLVYKTRCKLTHGDVDALPELARPLAEFLFTVMAARVTRTGDPTRPRYRLTEVGAGVGARVGTRDLVLSSDALEQLQAKLGVLQRFVLSGAERQLDRTRRLAYSSQSMIVDSPSVMLLETEHAEVVLRHLFLVDPGTGRLATIVWLIREGIDGRGRTISKEAVLVTPDLVSTEPLHVDGGQIHFGVPGATALAAVRMPPGKALAIPGDLRSIASAEFLTPRGAERLDAHFRQAIGFPAAY